MTILSATMKAYHRNYCYVQKTGLHLTMHRTVGLTDY